MRSNQAEWYWSIMYVMFREWKKHTRALKMEGTREHFNEHAHVANTAVYNIYISYYISPPSLNSARAEQQR